MDLSTAQWVRGITDSDVKARVGVPAFFRGRAYADEGAVRSIHVAAGQVIGIVSSEGPKVYRTQLSPAGLRGWTAVCSCPVHYDCKHAVALVLTIRAQLGPVVTAAPWESMLSSLVRVDERVEQSQHSAVALEVSLIGRDRSPTVSLRPAREGVRQPWVHSGASWSDVTWSGGRANVHPDQAALLSQLHQLSPPSYYNPAEIQLADLGPLAWPLLRRLLASGVVLLPSVGLSSVDIGAGEASVSLDITRTASGGLRVATLTSVDGEPVTTPGDEARAFLIGRPAHGVGRLASPGVLTMWPLREAPSQGMESFIEHGRQVDVPPEDVDRFLALYYPALARRTRVSSSDESVRAVEVGKPSLALGLTHRPGHTSELKWGMAYPSAGSPVVLPLAVGPGDPPRDLGAERRIVQPVTERLSESGLVTEGWASVPKDTTLTGLPLIAFLTRTLPWLREQGVQVTEHGSPPDYTEASEPPLVQVASDESDDRDWFNLHVTVTVAGQPVPFEELFIALARGDDAMLLDSGVWFPLDQPELQTLRKLIEEARELTDTPPGEQLRVSAFQAGWWEQLVELGVVARQSARWRESVDGLLSLADHSEEVVPVGVRASLRPYQVAGFRWLTSLWDARLGGVLADDMGLGKTLQTLALFERARERGELTGSPALVVAPASVLGTWVEEASRFAPGLNVVPITATAKRRGDKLATAVSGAHVVVTSYTLFRLEAAEYRALSWSGLVLDEAQFVKNHRSATYQAARRLGAPFTLAITGTPLENSLMDLWSMMSLAAPGLFARPELFDKRYRKPIENNRDVEALTQLRQRVRPFMLRRSKREVVKELPDKIEQLQRIDLAPAHRKIYDKHLQRERQRVLGMLDDMDRNRVAIFRALTMLRQLALDPGLVDAEHASGPPSSKVTALIEQVVELASEGHRALVFSSFTGFLKLVRQALDEAGISYSYLDGRTRDRPARIAAFRQGDDPVFLISLKAGGFGLTLTEADYVFVLDPWWNPAAENQAVDRTHRIGQTRSVNVYRMVSTDTIEEKVVALQERKRDLFASVMDSGDFKSGKITADDIRGLFDD